HRAVRQEARRSREPHGAGGHQRPAGKPQLSPGYACAGDRPGQGCAARATSAAPGRQRQRGAGDRRRNRQNGQARRRRKAARQDRRATAARSAEVMSAFAQALIAWQQEHGRHDLPWQRTRDPYAIWLSEIMLQQTQVATVIPYYQRFRERFPDIASLAAADEDEVLRLWSGLGYYSRARNLHRAAQRIVVQHGGVFPVGLADIEALPGIGRSTASAIAGFAYGA